MNENLAKNRAVLINPNDYKDLEFMLWMYDLRAIQTIPSCRYKGYNWVMFRCSNAKYQKLYEKMDSLGIWKGEMVEPKLSGNGLECERINTSDMGTLYDHYFMMGV